MARAEFNFGDLNTWLTTSKAKLLRPLPKKSSKTATRRALLDRVNLLERGKRRSSETTIPADQKSKREGFSIPEAPVRSVSVQAAPNTGNKKVEYTIDNRMEYTTLL